MNLLLLTALDPFAGARARAVQLPCVFAEAIAALDRAINAVQPVVTLALGLAAGRSGLWVERVAINPGGDPWSTAMR